MRTTTRIPIALTLFVAWAATAPCAVRADAGTPDLSGHWKLDPELSEEPAAGEEGGLRGGSPGRGGYGDRFGDGFREGPGRRGGPGRASPEEMRERMRRMRAGAERLHITQTGAALTLGFADGREQTFETDNKWHAVETELGEIDVRARWRDDTLFLRRRGRRGEITETYYVTSDKSLLTVLVEMPVPGPRGSASFKRIYRPYDPTAEPPADSEAVD